LLDFSDKVVYFSFSVLNLSLLKIGEKSDAYKNFEQDNHKLFAASMVIFFLNLDLWDNA